MKPRLMNLTAAGAVFISAASLLSLALATAAGRLALWPVWLSLAGAGAAAVFAFIRTPGELSESRKPGPFELAVILFFILFCLRNFLWIYYERDGVLYTLNRYPYADLHLHLAFIKNFLNDTRFWPENPVFVGVPLYYHFGMDLFTALFARAGMPLTSALPLVGLFCGLMTLYALYRWGGGFAVAGFLLAGGVAGYMVFTTGSIEDFQADLPWKNPALTMFLPQRGYLFALPAGLLVLWSWRRRLLEAEPGLPAWIEALLWSSMPFFQVHTFLFLSFVFAVWTVGTGQVKKMLPVYFGALPLAVPLMLLLTEFFHKSSMIWIKPGWMMDGDNPVLFFWINFGLFFPLVLWTAWSVFRRGTRAERFMFFPALAFFALLMFVMFGPWEWDNTKLMLWCYLMMLPVIESHVIRRLRYWARIPVVFALFLSGTVSILSSMDRQNTGVRIIDEETLDFVCQALKDMPPETRIAAAQEAYHPILLCGHKLVAGYSGNLVSAFGLNKDPVEQRLARLMKGEFDWREIARGFGVRYLFFGPHEERNFPDSNRPWEAVSLKLAGGRWGAVYDLETPSQIWGREESGPLPAEAGLRAYYFQGPDWKGDPVRTETPEQVNFQWEGGSRPFAAPFSMILEGEIFIPLSGEVSFYLSSDDGSLLEIGGGPVVDNSGVHAERVREGRVYLQKGWHPLRIHFSDVGGGAVLRLWWKLPGGEEEKIPVRYLRRKHGS